MIISVASKRARMRKGDASRLEARRLSFQVIFADRISTALGKVSLKRLSGGILRRLLPPRSPAPFLLPSSPLPLPRKKQELNLSLGTRVYRVPIGQKAFQRRSSRDRRISSFSAASFFSFLLSLLLFS